MAEQLPKRIFYTNIFELNYRPESGCEFFKVYDVSGVYVAYCKVLDTYIPRSKVKKCETSYETCPFRRFGLKISLAPAKES